MNFYSRYLSCLHMSSCKTLSSKISFGNRFHGFTSDCVKSHFLLFLLNLVLTPFWCCLQHILQKEFQELTSTHTQNAHIIFLCPLLFFIFWLVFSSLPYWEETAGKGEKGWMADFIWGNFNWGIFYISLSIFLSLL